MEKLIITKYMRQDNEENLILVIAANVNNIKDVKHKTENVYKTLLHLTMSDCEIGKIMEEINIEKHSEEFFIDIVKIYNFVIKFIKEEDQTEKICLEAVKKFGDLVDYVKNQTEEICIEAVKAGDALQYVKEQTEKICLEAVRCNGWDLQYVKEQTDEICLEAVKNNGLVLEYVKNQTEEICIEAIKGGIELYKIKEKTERMYIEIYNNIMKNNYTVIEEQIDFDELIYYNRIDEDGIKELIKMKPSLLQFVKEQTEEMCMEAVKRKPFMIFYVKEQTEEMCIIAVKKEGNALQ